MFLVLEQLQTATCIREKSEPEISGNLLDPFGDEKQNKSDTYIYTIHMNRRHGQSPVVGHVYMLRMMRQQRGSPASSEGSDRMGQN